MSPVTADTPFARLTDGHAKCVECHRPALYVVLTDDKPTYCAVHFALVAARASGMFA